MFHPTFFVNLGPAFVIHHHKKRKMYSSSVIEGVKKNDSQVLMEVNKPQLLCGDYMIEFFNKPKMSRKVSLHDES